MYISSFLQGATVLLVSYWASKYRQTDLESTLQGMEPNLGLPVWESFDFIIVGGGTAGSVMANRLSEHFTVLLLEAGGTPPPPIAVPAFLHDIWNAPAVHDTYTSAPQSGASLATGGIIKAGTAKMLGGCSSHNEMLYSRGNPLDYDNWVALTNDSSWNYKELLPYFKKSERYIGSLFNLSQHGDAGLVVVDDGNVPSTAVWLQAGREMGYEAGRDPNGPQAESFTTVAVTKAKGRRVSAYTAFLEPIEKVRRNLKVQRYSVVSEVLIEQKKAYGVRYLRHGIPQIAYASKEVILSAGLFGSPLILIKSGVGPRKVLEEAQIPLQAEAPVGLTFRDNVGVTLGPFFINDTTLFPTLAAKWDTNTTQEYLSQQGAGVEVLSNIQGSQAFLVSSRAKQSTGEEQWPDLLLIMDPGYLNQPPSPANNQQEQSHQISFFVALTRVRSAGSLSFNTTRYLAGVRDSAKLAVPDYNLFQDPSDVDVLLEGIKIVLKIVENTTAFQGIGASLSPTPNPVCQHVKFRSDDYWKCIIAQLSITLLNGGGPCRMGTGHGDREAVVDSQLRVLGVSNLRIADGSIMPRPPNTYTAAPIMMIGEKAAAMILEVHHMKS